MDTQVKIGGDEEEVEEDIFEKEEEEEEEEGDEDDEVGFDDDDNIDDGDDEVRWLCSVDTREEIGCDEEEENVLEEGDDQVEEEDDDEGEGEGHHQAGSSGPCGRDGSCTGSRWVDRGRGKTWCDHAGQQHNDNHDDVHIDDLAKLKKLL